MSAQFRGVYMTTNLYPRNRSKVAHLQLVQFKEKDLKLFVAEKVFGHLIADLQDLECNGVNVPYPNPLAVCVALTPTLHNADVQTM